MASVAKYPVRTTVTPLDSNLREGWMAAILVGSMLLALTGSVATAGWTEGLWVLHWAALAGLAFGMLVARLKLSPWLGHALAVLVGIALTAFLLSFLLPYVATWNEKLLVSETRLVEWLNRIIQGGIGADAFIFVLWTTAVSFLIAYVGAWSVFGRDQPWGAILPVGIGMLVNLTYAQSQSALFLLVFLLAALLLLVRTNLVTRQREWRRASIGYASDIGLDFLTYGVVFSGLVILTAWVVPTTTPAIPGFGGLADAIYRPWNEFTDHFARSFSTLKSVSRAGPTTYFGQSLALGGPVQLGTQPVLDITSSAGRYWRATVFDKYTGVGWVSTASDVTHFLAEDPKLQIPSSGQRQEITQTVQVLFPDGDLIVASAQPVRLSVATDIRYSPVRATGDNTLLDIATIRTDHRIQAGAQYTVVSSISIADEKSLRASEPKAPAWIQDRYLQLPDGLPQRVRDLAVQISSSSANNYDKARAIEAYLRANIVYNDHVSAPPDGRDAVDFTLFDRKEGYCNYYASAMTVLARAVGIPARVASGYTLGETDGNTFHVKESDAHSWPELYFSGLGWVEFEPTASKPVVDRPSDSSDFTGFSGAGLDNPDDQDILGPAQRRPIRGREDALDDPAAADSGPVIIPGGAIVGGSILAVLLLLAGVVGAAELVWLRRVGHLPPASRAYEEMFRFGRWLGLPESQARTPYEQAAVLKERVPQAQEPITRVSNLYVRERYGRDPLSSPEHTEASTLRWRMRRQIWQSILKRNIERIASPLRAAYARWGGRNRS